MCFTGHRRSLPLKTATEATTPDDHFMASIQSSAGVECSSRSRRRVSHGETIVDSDDDSNSRQRATDLRIPDKPAIVCAGRF